MVYIKGLYHFPTYGASVCSGEDLMGRIGVRRGQSVSAIGVRRCSQDIGNTVTCLVHGLILSISAKDIGR
jgi:hypothetical protein